MTATPSSLNAFHVAYWVIFAVSVLGAVTAAVTFQQRSSQSPGPQPALADDSAHAPAIQEPAADPG